MVLAINYRPEVRLHLTPPEVDCWCQRLRTGLRSVGSNQPRCTCQTFYFYRYLKLASYARCLLLQVMMGFIAEWEPKLGVKIVCSQVRCALAARPAVVSDSCWCTCMLLGSGSTEHTTCHAALSD